MSFFILFNAHDRTGFLTDGRGDHFHQTFCFAGTFETHDQLDHMSITLLFESQGGALCSDYHVFALTATITFQFASGLPSRENIFFLYASTPGWSNGLTPDI